MKTNLLLALLASGMFAILSCNKNSKDNISDPSVTDGQTELTPAELNALIEKEVSDKGSFEWGKAGAKVIWSALKESDYILSVGYKPAAISNTDDILSELNLQAAEWKEARQKVLSLILAKEKERNPSLTLAQIEVWKNEKLPVINIVVRNPETVRLLLASPLVRYAEPMGYDPIAYEEAKAAEKGLIGFGGSGCGGYGGVSSLVEDRDFTVIEPGTKMSWNYASHSIESAWTKSTGSGVKVMVIDTGVSPDQDNLGSNFNQGYSANRTLQKIFTLPSVTNANDACGHGTTMSGAIAAPRGTDGNSCGVAYNCDLVVCRAAQDVYLDASKEIKGVSDAYVLAADDPAVKIISLSLGRITSSGQLKDAIVYAYGKGKLMFCAGGTSFPWTSGFTGVIFPASLPQVQAITGVQNKATLVACQDCHKGKQIDFVVVMEQTATGVHQISTATNGDIPTLVGGSSVATATASGIAALVWSKFPSLTRDQVVTKLAVTASLYPAKSSSFGWGLLNADAATQ